MRVAYGRKLREFLTTRMSLHQLLDFGRVPIFGASVNTCILLVENVIPTGNPFLAATFRDIADIPHLPSTFQEHAISVQARDLSAEGWALTSPEALELLEKVQQTGTLLERHVSGSFYMGIKTGCNAAFIIDESVRQQLISQAPNSDDLIRPVLRGRKLHRWKTVSVDEYLIAIASSINIEWPWSNAENDADAERIFAETYPAIYEYLNAYRQELIERGDQGRFYWELRSCAYYAEFGKPKIVYPQTASSLYACYDTGKAFGLNNIYFIPTSDLSLLAILNSSLFDWYARHKFYSLNDPWAGGGLQFFAQYMERVPIANRTSEQKATLSQLVERILADPEGDEVYFLEQEIDQQVYQLYGLTCEDITLIKRTYEEAEMQR